MSFLQLLLIPQCIKLGCLLLSLTSTPVYHLQAIPELTYSGNRIAPLVAHNLLETKGLRVKNFLAYYGMEVI